MQQPATARSVQLAVLQQLAERGKADQQTTATRCPGSDARDMVAAFQSLLDEGLIEPSLEPHELVEAARTGVMAMTAKGRDRLSQDVA